MSDPIILLPYDRTWQDQFVNLATPIREALGDIALRIDHIGSTAIPHLAAKPIIDIQVSVESFEPFDLLLKPFEHLGYRWRKDNADLTKRYFREPENQQRTHIHVRILGSWSQQFALLFRDYLRVNHDDAKRYETKKVELAKLYEHDRTAYVNEKSPIIWEIMQRASSWSQSVGWFPAESDL